MDEIIKLFDISTIAYKDDVLIFERNVVYFLIRHYVSAHFNVSRSILEKSQKMREYLVNK